MSDVRFHPAVMTLEQRLKHIAQQAAFEMGHDQSYTPKTREEQAAFDPHKWVIEAVTRAYYDGVRVGQSSVRDQIRGALGL